jgi:lipopolysaccharide/colanic/teichoic acid biosynthesis glycosyltransferase
VTRGEIAFTIISGLLVNEATDICPWLAIRLTRWAARVRYPHAPERAATRSEELAALINDRPGKLFKLFTALGFALHALVLLRRNQQPEGMTGWRAAAKRTVDVGIAAVALVLALPLMLVIALAIRLTSPGPVFFYQERVTKGGRIFRMYKFRVMRTPVGVAADATMPFYSLNVDPRPTRVGPTRVGRFLHRLGLDELPQFWNVLKGDMSIVGPRPLPAYQVDANLELLRPRLEVPAGVTGWWQIHGRRGVTPEEAIRLDQYYIENWSLRLDLYILVKTFAETLRWKGVP